MKRYYVYILSNASRTLYVGVTNDIERRMHEHLNKLVPGLTSRYNLAMLVHLEDYANPRDAIAREKAIKGWLRSRKIALVEANNPD